MNNEKLYAVRAEIEAMMEKKRASWYWVLTIIYPIRGAVHYTCKTEDGAWRIARDTSRSCPDVKIIVKRHTFEDALG